MPWYALRVAESGGARYSQDVKNGNVSNMRSERKWKRFTPI